MDTDILTFYQDKRGKDAQGRVLGASSQGYANRTDMWENVQRVTDRDWNSGSAP